MTLAAMSFNTHIHSPDEIGKEDGRGHSIITGAHRELDTYVPPLSFCSL